jgi:hypothetical protein
LGEPAFGGGVRQILGPFTDDAGEARSLRHHENEC